MRLPEREEVTEADNMLPLINVVFLLLIFFMLAGALQAVDLFDVDAPVSVSAETEENAPPLILIAADGRLAIDDGAVDALGLQLRVTDLLVRDPDLLLRVKADLRTEARRVVEVMELLNAVGVERILLLSLEDRP